MHRPDSPTEHVLNCELDMPQVANLRLQQQPSVLGDISRRCQGLGQVTPITDRPLAAILQRCPAIQV